jgi:hypothetical protein
MIEDTNPKSSVLRVSNGCDAAVFAADGFSPAVEETDVAVLGPGRHHALQRELSEFI